MNISPPNPKPPADTIEPLAGFVAFEVELILNAVAVTELAKVPAPALVI
jgi:hypothetical protein